MTPRLDALLESKAVYVLGDVYVGKAADGVEVYLGHEAESVEEYLTANPTPEDW